MAPLNMNTIVSTRSAVQHTVNLTVHSFTITWKLRVREDPGELEVNSSDCGLHPTLFTFTTPSPASHLCLGDGWWQNRVVET